MASQPVNLHWTESFMLNVRPSTESRCLVSVVWPAETCTSRDFHNVCGTTMSQNIQIFFITTFYQNVLFSYRVQWILGGLYRTPSRITKLASTMHFFFTEGRRGQDLKIKKKKNQKITNLYSLFSQYIPLTSVIQRMSKFSISFIHRKCVY